MDGSLITTYELNQFGFDVVGIRSLMRRGALARVHRGVYLIGDAPLDFHRRGHAALLATGPPAALSEPTALGHWLLRPVRPGPVHVSVPGRGGRERREGIVVHRPLRLPEHDVTEHEGLRTTTPTRTLLDTSRWLPRYARFRALEQAERERLDINRDRLDACPRLHDPLYLFDRLGPCTRSDAEAMFLLICLDFGIPLPVVNQVHEGTEFDMRWPGRLIVEVDGFDYHDGQPVTGRERFEKDRERGLFAAELGYRFERFSAKQLRRERARVARVVQGRLRP